MTALPARESVPHRLGRYLLAFVASPIWIWLGLVTVVVLFRHPILHLLSMLGQITFINMLLLLVGLVVTLTYVSYQMVKSL